MRTADVIETMMEIVERKLVLYKDDFYKYDMERIAEEHPREFVWMVRDTGTHMMTPLAEGENKELWLDRYELFKRFNDWFYYVRMNADGSGEVVLSEKRCNEFAARITGKARRTA
jgi:hypothetical protein